MKIIILCSKSKFVDGLRELQQYHEINFNVIAPIDPKNKGNYESFNKIAHHSVMISLRIHFLFSIPSFRA